ncbi:MAG: nitrophenyl compound nitroreductase subunit ArsF family protein [Bacteroidales bacterium]
MIKSAKYSIGIFLMAALFVACGDQGEQEQDKKEHDKQKEEISGENASYGDAKVEIYYFHGNRRCANCNAIEEVVKNLVNEKYGNNEDVMFYTLNYEAEKNEAIAEKHDIRMSSLIIVSEGKSVDLTMDAFQNAKSKPEYLKNEITTVINDFLS